MPRAPCAERVTCQLSGCCRSLRYAETGVWQSSMNVWCTGIRLWSRASDRAVSSDGWIPVKAASGLTTAIEHAFGVGKCQTPPPQQHRQVVDDIRGLLGNAVVGLLARRAHNLFGLLLDLGAGERRVGEQRRRVGTVGTAFGALRDRALERGKRLVGRGRLEVTAVKARPLAGVARGTDGLDDRQQRVAVAVVADRP